jgi:hypothetical protein
MPKKLNMSDVKQKPIDTIPTLDMDLSKIMNLEDKCIDPIARTIITESLEYAIDVSMGRLASIGKIFPRVESTAMNTAMPIIKTIYDGIQVIPECKTGVITGVKLKLPDEPPAKLIKIVASKEKPTVSGATVTGTRKPTKAELVELVKEQTKNKKKQAFAAGTDLGIAPLSWKQTAAKEAIFLNQPEAKIIKAGITPAQVEQKFLAGLTGEQRQTLAGLKASSEEIYQQALEVLKEHLTETAPAPTTTILSAKMAPQHRTKKPTGPLAPPIIKVPAGSAGLGMRIKLEYEGQPLDITLVSPTVAKDARIITVNSQKQSTDSKLARAIMGHSAGETIEMEIDKKKKPIKIVEVTEGSVRPVKAESAEAVFGETEGSKIKE